MDSRIHHALRFIEQNLNSRVTEKELAHQAGLTPQHFCLLFKTEVNETPARYLRTLRMEKARKLLESTRNSRLSIKEIATTVGFDFSHFVRDFDKRFGQSPARYRATKLNK